MLLVSNRLICFDYSFKSKPIIYKDPSIFDAAILSPPSENAILWIVDFLGFA